MSNSSINVCHIKTKLLNFGIKPSLVNGSVLWQLNDNISISWGRCSVMVSWLWPKAVNTAFTVTLLHVLCNSQTTDYYGASFAKGKHVVLSLFRYENLCSPHMIAKYNNNSNIIIVNLFYVGYRCAKIGGKISRNFWQKFKEIRYANCLSLLNTSLLAWTFSKRRFNV